MYFVYCALAGRRRFVVMTTTTPTLWHFVMSEAMPSCSPSANPLSIGKLFGLSKAGYALVVLDNQGVVDVVEGLFNKFGLHWYLSAIPDYHTGDKSLKTGV